MDGLHLMVPTEHNISHRVLKLFAAYFPHDPQGFCCCLDNTHAIISGSSVLCVLVGCMTWSPSDLDIIMLAHLEAQLMLFLLQIDIAKCHNWDMVMGGMQTHALMSSNSVMGIT